MSDLRAAAAEYLALRRALGFRLTHAEQILRGLVSYLDERGITTITTGAALAWATQPAHAQPWWWSQRLTVARGFARYLQAFDPATEVPPPGLIRAPAPRATPYPFTEADIAALMAAAGRLRPALRAATYQALIGLLAVTGMRAGEVLALDDTDVALARDADAGPGQDVITVRHAKFGKSRELVLHPTTARALGGYQQTRRQHCPQPVSPAFFVSARGRRLQYDTVKGVYYRLAHVAGLAGPDGKHLPRLHDLRHSFAVTTLAGWHAAGLDTGPLLPALSTYLGHIEPADTYWYLSATTELLGHAARRLETSPETPR
jgi:integrase